MTFSVTDMEPRLIGSRRADKMVLGVGIKSELGTWEY